MKDLNQTVLHSSRPRRVFSSPLIPRPRPPRPRPWVGVYFPPVLSSAHSRILLTFQTLLFTFFPLFYRLATRFLPLYKFLLLHFLSSSNLFIFSQSVFEHNSSFHQFPSQYLFSSTFQLLSCIKRASWVTGDAFSSSCLQISLVFVVVYAFVVVVHMKMMLQVASFYLDWLLFSPSFVINFYL